MARITRKENELRFYNVVVTLINGLTTTANQVEAESKSEVFEKYLQDNLYYKCEEILSITVIEVQ